MLVSTVPIAILAMLCSLGGTPDEDQNWPSFRGSQARGYLDGYPTPAEWDVEDSVNVRWKVPITGLGHSCPAIWGDRIFVTTAVKESGESSLKVGLYGSIEPVEEDEPFTWHLYCINKEDGKVLWEKKVFEGKPKIKRHPKSSHANATPCTDGKHLVVFLGSEGLHCYDMEGKLLWKKDLGVLDSGYYMVKSAQWGGGASPVIHEDRVILQCDVQKNSFLAAYDLKDGAEVWKTSRDEVPTWGTPTVYTGEPRAQIIVNGFKHIGAYALDTGKEIWKLRGGGDIPVPTPVVHDGLVFITNAHGMMAPVYAVSLSATGDISLEGGATANKHIPWSIKRGGCYMPTPIAYHGLLYCCADTGRLTCYEAKTGKVHYSQNVSSRRKAFTASPVAASDKIYCTSEKGFVFVVAAGPEYELLAVNTMEETCMATPAVSKGVLYFRTRHHLVAIGEDK